MTVVLGEIADIARSLNEDILRLSAMIRQINAITGSSPDPHYDYELFSTIPTLQGDMEALAASLREKEETVRRLAQKTPAMAGNFQSIASQLDSMIRNPFSIAGRIGELNNALTTLGTWYNDVQVQPLMIDYFLLGSPDAAWGNPQSSIWQKIWATLWNFLISFQKDYDSIGGVAGDVEITDTLDIWVAPGNRMGGADQAAQRRTIHPKNRHTGQSQRPAGGAAEFRQRQRADAGYLLRQCSRRRFGGGAGFAGGIRHPGRGS